MKKTIISLKLYFVCAYNIRISRFFLQLKVLGFLNLVLSIKNYNNNDACRNVYKTVVK